MIRRFVAVDVQYAWRVCY